MRGWTKAGAVVAVLAIMPASAHAVSAKKMTRLTSETSAICASVLSGTSLEKAAGRFKFGGTSITESNAFTKGRVRERRYTLSGYIGRVISAGSGDCTMHAFDLSRTKPSIYWNNWRAQMEAVGFKFIDISQNDDAGFLAKASIAGKSFSVKGSRISNTKRILGGFYVSLK